ncbi:MAG: imidazolonepropionase [Alphaproteobacteria bacterium HGW-Alphaproteobacteria-18]|nr:MAG: imidazolonepropionase [Alphaproteobacteria bacterium HGW-Alphaproteobacteria-18]
MMHRSVILVVALAGLAVSAFAEPIVLRGARIMTADTAGTIEGGTILIDKGRIVAVGRDVHIPAGATVVDVAGKTITPGFIATDSVIGMVEISGGSDASETSSRIGRISAGYDVQYAINPFSATIPVARKGGVTRAIVMPNPGADNATFSGQAAILSLVDGATAEVIPQVGIIWDMRTSAYGRGATFVQLRADLQDVRRFARDPALLAKGELGSREWSQADLEALVPISKGTKPLAVRVNRASDILTLIDIAASEKIRLILVGAAEGWVVADQIARAGVPVVIDPSDNLPGNFDEIGATSDNAAKLHAAGVQLILRGGSAAHDAGKVRLFAGLAIARGVPTEAALRAVTVTPARVWGMSDFGALAPGQIADLAIWSGDPFEPMTELNALYIGGEAQSLSSRQDALERRYIPAARASASIAKPEQE